MIASFSFSLPSSSLTFLFIVLYLIGPSVCDLRYASQPRAGFAVRQREQVKFVSKSVIYMEPSDFEYNGIAQLRQSAYDSFLRLSIDHMQDRRNFQNEAGRDQLPFRSFEGQSTDSSNTVQTKIPNGDPGPVITATPGQAYLLPLRWNNPHAAEVELNIWIMNVAVGAIVIPIKKPVCSGEGHQDNVIDFIVPTDFNALGSQIPGFTGCKKEGDCVLQLYAHSVEPRTYAAGTPIVVTGNVATPTAIDTSKIKPVEKDVGLDLSKLWNALCLSATDPSANIVTAVPRFARLISDAFNHAYQNSDYSPYSGQQPEAISRNLQAACILAMIPANRGELGQSIVPQQSENLAAQLRSKVNNLIQKYEEYTNKIIARIGDNVMKNTAVVGANGVQRLAECFRCAETASVTTTRLITNTYVPSFRLPADQIEAAKNLVPAALKGLISDTGVVQIYMTVLNDMKAEFKKAALQGFLYQPAMIKSTLTTMTDMAQFKKKNAQGQSDRGQYAASQAEAARKASAQSVSQNLVILLHVNGTTPLG